MALAAIFHIISSYDTLLSLLEAKHRLLESSPTRVMPSPTTFTSPFGLAADNHPAPPDCHAVIIPKRGSLSRSSTSSDVSHASVTSAATLVGEHIKHCEEVCLECGTFVSALPAVNKPDDLVSPGRDIALKPLVGKLKERLRSQLEGRPEPKLVGLLATDDAGCQAYASATAKTCASSGIEFETRQVEHDYEAVRRAIMSLNEDASVAGLLVYFPIFGPDIDNHLRGLISARIDVEGVHPDNLARSSRDPPSLMDEPSLAVHPCTSLAVVRILQDQGLYDLSASPGGRLRGKVATVVNRSETVGKPLALMLANEGATVFSVDIHGVQVFERHAGTLCIRTILSPDAAQDYCFGVADVIVSAVPSARYKVPTAAIKPGTVCINVAMDDNFEADVKRRAGLYARRVGSVTTMMLQMNAVSLQGRSEA